MLNTVETCYRKETNLQNIDEGCSIKEGQLSKLNYTPGEKYQQLKSQFIFNKDICFSISIHSSLSSGFVPNFTGYWTNGTDGFHFSGSIFLITCDRDMDRIKQSFQWVIRLYCMVISTLNKLIPDPNISARNRNYFYFCLSKLQTWNETITCVWF